MLAIEATKSNPKVTYNEGNNTLSIVGRSVLKNMDDEFYNPIFDFLKRMKLENNEGLKVEFLLDYFNTSSHPSLINIFKLTSEIEKSEIVWLYEMNDLEMMEIGNELSRYSPNPINVKQMD